MSIKGDYYLDEDFEMTIVNGDFQVNEDTQQDVNFIIQTNIGQIRYLPTYGVGIQNYLNSNDSLSVKRKIIEQSKKILVDINKVYVDFSDDTWDIEVSVKKINSSNAE